MADTRLFRINYFNGVVKYGERRVLGPAVSYSKNQGGGYRKGQIHTIEATNADATEGWSDVTREFLGHGRSLFETLCDPMGDE